MTVVDADLVLQLVLRTGDYEAARTAFIADPDWIAPPLWRSDFRGQLARRVGSGELTIEAAEQLFAGACEVIVQEVEPETGVVLELVREGMDPYDAEYAAVARTLGLPYLSGLRG